MIESLGQQRVKVWGTAREVEDDANLLARLSAPNYSGKLERAIVFTAEEWDSNRPHPIHRRYSKRQVGSGVGQLPGRIRELEEELKRLRAGTEPDY